MSRTAYSPILTSAISLILFAALVATGCGGDSPTSPSGGLRVATITPSSGSTTDTTRVTITGTGFDAASTVTIGGVPATEVALQGTSALTALVAPRATAGPADVTVTASGRSNTLTAGFTFVAPSSSNRPPVVTNIRSIGSRQNQPSGFADLDETITLVATASDNETPDGGLTYKWSGVGTFSGTGNAVSWRAPATAASTPMPVVLTLVVSEQFSEGGVTHTNLSTPTPFTVQLHDSQKEILDLGEDFLTLFSNSTIPVDTVLHNFSATCDKGNGRSAEASDTARARSQYTQDFSRFRISRLPPVMWNFGGACVAFGEATRVRPSDACGLFAVHWEVTYITNVDAQHRVGTREVTDGKDNVTAVLENNQWRLCHSDFQGTSVIPSTGFTQAVRW